MSMDTQTAETILDNLGMTPRELRRADGMVAATKAAAQNAETFIEYPTTIDVRGESLHLFQKVHEHVDNPLADDEIVEWTVCGLDGGEILLKDAGSWNRKERLSYEEFVEGPYTPVYADDGSPMWGY